MGDKLEKSKNLIRIIQQSEKNDNDEDDSCSGWSSDDPQECNDKTSAVKDPKRSADVLRKFLASHQEKEIDQIFAKDYKKKFDFEDFEMPSPSKSTDKPKTKNPRYENADSISPRSQTFALSLQSIGKVDPLFEVLYKDEESGEDSIEDKHIDSFDELDSLTNNHIHFSNIEDTSTVISAKSSENEAELETSSGGTSAAEKKKYFGNLLKSVSSQLSFSHIKATKKKSGTKINKQNLKSESVTDFNYGDLKNPNSFLRHPHKKMTDSLKRPDRKEEITQTPVEAFDFNPAVHTDPDFKNGVTITLNSAELTSLSEKEFENGPKVTSLPNWLSEFEEPDEESGEIDDYLNEALQKEYEETQKSHSEEWEKAIAISKQTVTRDFRNISVYISAKIEFPKKGILTVAYAKNADYLIVGGEQGLLKLLEMKHEFVGYDNPDDFISSCPKVKDIGYRILRHESLIGHLQDVQHVQWRGHANRIMSTDASGIIIGWEIHKKAGRWSTDIVQDQTGSTILQFAWSPECSRVLVLYHDTNPLGADEYGIVLGLADGTREWKTEFEDSPPQGIAWLDEKKFALLYNNCLSVRHTNGITLQTRYFGDIDSDNSKGKVVALLSKYCASWTDRFDKSPFSIVIVWQLNKLMLLRTVEDPHPITVQTRLNSTCADWSSNGLFIAVGGTLNDQEEFSQVNVYNSVGKLLTVVRLNHPHLSSVSWDQSNYFLAMGAKNMLYIGAVRPSYKFASSGTTVSYAFQADDKHFIAFWDIVTLTYNCQKIDGRLVEIKSHGERFAMLSINPEGLYCASVLKKCGTVIDALVILTMEPTSVCFTDQCLIALSAKSLIFWRYKSSLHDKQSNDNTLKNNKDNTKLLRQIHIDDHPSLIPTIVLDNLNEDYNKPTMDPAVCMDAKLDRLCVARLSGNIQIYCLPHGGLLQTIALEKFNPFLLMFNPLADTLVLVDTSGGIRYGKVSPTCVEILERLPTTTEAIDIMWSRDMPYYLCVLERTKMTIFRGTEIAEEFFDVNSLSGYLTNFENMDITLIQLEDILATPTMPDLKYILTHEMNILHEIQKSYDSGDIRQIDDLKQIVQDLNQPKLWNMLGEEELKRLSFFEAEYAFVHARNYSALQLLSRLKFITDPLLQQAEIYAFLEIHTAASNYYVRAGRKDLALEMWKTLDDLEQQSLISDHHFSIVGSDSGDTLKTAFETAENLFSIGAFEPAVTIYWNLKNYERVFECLVRLDDCDGLKRLGSYLPMNDPLLLRIAERFSFIGLTCDAVNLFLLYGAPEKAVNTALGNLEWNLALEIAEDYKVPMVSEVLLKTTGQLLNSGDVLQGVRFLEKCGKTFAAGKLLATVALKQLREVERPDPLTIKKLFVMSALLFQRKPVKNLTGSKSQLRGKSRMGKEDEIDLKFDESIPEEYRPQMDELRWMRQDPWRGAHAIHFYITAQKRIYDGRFIRAMILANHLRIYTDILGEERINCLLALAAIKGDCIMTGLGALSHLEIINTEYRDLAPEILSSKEAIDVENKNVNRSRCCGADLIDNDTLCPTCNKRVPVCMVSGKTLNSQDSIWTCNTCKGTASSKKIKHFEFCPVCHTDVVRSASVSTTSIKI